MTTATPAILVVEDELPLRLMAVDVVETSGFEALSAATADEALSILEARADDVRLVFTDIHMPGSMDGLRLAHAVRDRWPPVELIITSGRRHVGADDLVRSKYWNGREPVGWRHQIAVPGDGRLFRTVRDAVAEDQCGVGGGNGLGAHPGLRDRDGGPGAVGAE